MIRTLLLTASFVASTFGASAQQDWYSKLPGAFITTADDFYSFIADGKQQGLVTFAKGILKKCPHCKNNVAEYAEAASFFTKKAQFMTFDVAAVGAKVTKPFKISRVPVVLVFHGDELVFNQGVHYTTVNDFKSFFAGQCS